MRKLTTILLTGVAALAFTACGGSSSSGGSSTPAQPAEPSGPPLSDNGNQILLPGYEYDITLGETYEMYVSDVGNVVFAGCQLTKVYDANFNAYGETITNTFNAYFPGSYQFDAGQYYVQKGGSWDKCTMTVQSNVLYNPLAQ